MRLKPLYVMQALAIASISMSANAETQTTTQFKMPALQVVGTEGSKEERISRQTGAVVLIDREEIERIQPTSTEDVLRRVPGINAKTEEESAVVSNIGIRGLSASESKSLILEDGVPVAPGLFIGNDRYFNPRIQRMEGIEILKGSSSLRYGPSTIGGVINYITKTPDDGVHVSTRVGSFNTREATLEAGGRTESGDSFAGIVATRALSDGFMDRGYRMSDILVKAGTKLNENHSLGVKYSYHENEANISYRGMFLNDYKAGRTYNPAPDDYYLTDRRAVDVNHEWHLTDNATLTTLAYWSDMSRDYWRYAVPQGNVAASNAAGRWVYSDNLTGNNRSFERYGIESRLAVDHNLFGISNQAEFGLRFMQEESDDKTIGATRANDRSGTLNRYLRDEADSVAGYVQNRFEITDRFAVTPGIRIESYEQKRNVLIAQNPQQLGKVETNNTEVLPGIGATYQLIPEAQLYGGVYKAFSPASNGTSLVGENNNLVDQKLDGERSVNYELGVRGEIDRMTYELTGFYMDFDNLVVTGNSDPNLSRSNAGESKHYGLEAALGYELGGGFSVDTNLTWVPYSKFEAGEFDGNRLPYSPKFLANVALNYTQGKFSSSLTAHHRGEQYGNEANDKDIPEIVTNNNTIWGGLMPSYTVYDLYAQYQVSEQFRVRGAVKNLTDKLYITGLRQGIYVGPERSFEVGFDYSF
ncbi:TonB-dependent receptor family protein [Methylophaga muralis]|uniref:Fe(3+) dicitrate transport protein FecA n=1 Tax=Methylophaga muralis TaxID=291169 RepID=A0A1E3GRV9_9GAMM|nr:TonB-dependent receptor [Methylophaga muralis]ODN66790.1 Fe(3+) dicitrate transport protein FecA precursor [Methylophaga muralis]